MICAKTDESSPWTSCFNSPTRTTQDFPAKSVISTRPDEANLPNMVCSGRLVSPPLNIVSNALIIYNERKSPVGHTFEKKCPTPFSLKMSVIRPYWVWYKLTAIKIVSHKSIGIYTCDKSNSSISVPFRPESKPKKGATYWYSALENPPIFPSLNQWSYPRDWYWRRFASHP